MKLQFDHQSFLRKIAWMLNPNSDCGMIDRMKVEGPPPESLEYVGKTIDIILWRLFMCQQLLLTESKLIAEVHVGSTTPDHLREEFASSALVDQRLVILKGLVSERIVDLFPEEGERVRKYYVLVGHTKRYAIFAENQTFSATPKI